VGKREASDDMFYVCGVCGVSVGSVDVYLCLLLLMKISDEVHYSPSPCVIAFESHPHSTLPSTRPLHSTRYGHHPQSVARPRSRQPRRRHRDEENVRHEGWTPSIEC
jgi:hypothetical protein